MIYVEHDFYMNLSEAVNSNDERLIKDLFRYELSTLIGKERKELRKLYEACGLSYPKGASNEVLTKSVLGNIRKGDRRFTTGVAVLIARQEGLINAVEKDRERGNGEEPEKKQKASDVISKISLSMKIFFDNMSKEEYIKFRNGVLKKVNTINRKYSSATGTTTRPTQGVLDAQRKAKRKKMIMVGVGIGLLVLGYVAYKKGWLAKLGIGGGNKMADGGAIPSAAPVSQPAPALVAAPAPAAAPVAQAAPVAAAPVAPAAPPV